MLDVELDSDQPDRGPYSRAIWPCSSQVSSTVLCKVKSIRLDVYHTRKDLFGRSRDCCWKPTTGGLLTTKFLDM